MYIPFAFDQKLYRTAYTIVEMHNVSFNLVKFEKKVYHANLSSNALAGISPKQQVYICGHGIPGRNVIWGSGEESITMIELANQFVQQKLTKKIKTIKLFSCHSGSGSGEMASTASQLFDALQSLGFDDVEVAGYQGRLSTFKELTFIEDTELINKMRPSRHRVYFRA